ncbi:glycoside hydrolase family 3 C-terminal domain-containing protein [Streptomyces sp. NPDC060194]|uniref:glycoside hydrolase family 3 protein n=1 Tax=Streptomyces sp. NPDC060194 TaxID=3347069 RepID=UPI003650FB16
MAPTPDAPDAPDARDARATAVEAAVEKALAALDLDTKARLLAGQDSWTLPPLPGVGLASLVMSDGPIGVRGGRWTADDPSIALPSPTALGATWDPALARRTGRLLAQEARRKGVHVLLAPTVNLHRSPLGGRHFEAYSEDPYLTGEIGTGYVAGVQDGGVGTTVKHFVANDAETDRFTVDNVVADRALRELYLAPFEAIVANARPWGVMSAYNAVNGTTMTEHGHLQNDVLRGEWGFDGFVVSDWTAARSTVGDILGGTDVAMPGPRTVYGEALAAAVRAGEVDEAKVDGAVRNVLRLAARVGALEGVPAEVPEAELPEPVDGAALAREVARRSFVLLRNELRGGRPVLPLAPTATVALSGAAARDPREQGGGSARVFPAHVVSALEGLTAALPDGALTYTLGADPAEALTTADKGFDLEAVCRDADGKVLGSIPLHQGEVFWIGADFPDGVAYEELHSVDITGTFTPRVSGLHHFGTRGVGDYALTVGGRELFSGTEELVMGSDPFESVFGTPVERGAVDLEAGVPVAVTLNHPVFRMPGAPIEALIFSLVHGEPERDEDELIAEAVAAARASDAAVVVVATTSAVESEGYDREHLRLPGRQDDLVRAVAAANPNTVVVVNAGSPVEMPWREDVAAVLLTWFPGQEGGAALADVLLGAEEPAGRLPTTWPVALADAPVSDTRPVDGQLPYTEGVFIGYRAWDRAGRTPAYPFGHGLGYTTWSYDSLTVDGARATVRITNTGDRPGRETVQLYLAPVGDDASPVERPARRLAAFANAAAEPGETVEVELDLPERAFQVWHDGGWHTVPGGYELLAAHAIDDVRARAGLTR